MAFSHTLQIFNARVGEIQISVFVSTTDMFWLRADSWKIENETFCYLASKLILDKLCSSLIIRKQYSYQRTFCIEACLIGRQCSGICRNAGVNGRTRY